MRSISSLIDETTALNSMPIDPSSRIGFTMTGKCSSSRERQAAAERAREHGRRDAVEREDLLRDALVLREHQAVAAGAGKRLADELEIRGDVVVGGVVAAERLAEIEDDVAIELRRARAGSSAIRRADAASARGPAW